MVKIQPVNAGDTRDVGSILGSGRSPGVGNGNLLQYSCLENSMDRGACWATVLWGRKESDMTVCAHVHIHTHTHTHSHTPSMKDLLGITLSVTLKVNL